MMKYKGYEGLVVYDDQAKLFHGEVIGLRDVITFQSTSVDELEQAFKGSVDDYLEWCQARGEAPEKAFSGKLHIRITPELHAKLVQEAARRKVSLNSFIIDQLSAS